ncbi:hypothetical protein [Taibaiella koreensis]|uniref:hypothetical protein n=1 Tax=Taibaiella koreensis TaxID=1268548 RepID=UPI0013C2D86C|nr:hypothetical protein [Taibaiella koreensis]
MKTKILLSAVFFTATLCIGHSRAMAQGGSTGGDGRSKHAKQAPKTQNKSNNAKGEKSIAKSVESKSATTPKMGKSDKNIAGNKAEGGHTGNGKKKSSQ